jgi:hypothetical protein
MDDLERWLRTTMQAATQDAPRNLLPGVWRRRRAHLRRVGAGGAAAVAAIAIAVPSVLQSTAGGHPGSPAASSTAAHAAPGSELLTCGMYTIRGIAGGELSPHWKSSSIQVGPVFFIGADSGAWRSSQRLSGGKLRAVAGDILAVRNGTTAEITTSQPARFRFVTSQSRAGRYTLRDGFAGVTLAGCPRYPIPHDIPAADAAELTIFYLPLGYVTDLTGCLPVQIRMPPSWKARWTAGIPLKGGRCTS